MADAARRARSSISTASSGGTLRLAGAPPGSKPKRGRPALSGVTPRPPPLAGGTGGVGGGPPGHKPEGGPRGQGRDPPTPRPDRPPAPRPDVRRLPRCAPLLEDRWGGGPPQLLTERGPCLLVAVANRR